ncbi:putative 2-aminoethylphosphonate ABC transporter substrate-binding protein [Siminovitchia sp. FSL H7-0308]|uniref:putative 2-aminoethylphosphonate ABC transporter substrate-binding protein n=1 Tax=Siminovitchia sp. FSL H7-0308 TaxID=2921432 RepID=UPI0030ED36B5
MKKPILLLIAVSLFALIIAGCSGGSKDSKETSGKEASDSGKKEKITVYSSYETEELEEYMKRFEEAHPEIEVDLVRDSTGVTTSKLLAEKDNPVADVVFGVAASSLLFLEEHDLLEGYNPKGIERLEPKFKDQVNDPALWTGNDAFVAAIAVNTQELERLGVEAPKSYKDLLDPKYKDLIVMPNPASSGTGFLMVNAWLQMFEEEGGWEFMDGLHKNMNQYVHSGSKPAKAVARGEFPIGLTFAYPVISEIEKGAPVELVLPSEGSGWEIEANALVKKPEIKEAAKTFLDWAISDNAMEGYQQYHGVVAVNMDTKANEGFPENIIDQMIDNDFSWAAQNREGILDEWLKRYDEKSAPEEE